MSSVSQISLKSSTFTEALNEELVALMKSWRDAVPGLVLLCFYNPKTKHIVVELISIPVSKRRQGICGEVLDELTDIARLYDVEIWLEPDDAFGTPKQILSKMYQSYGFSWVDAHWMRKK